MKSPTAVLLTIGDELLYGQTLDTNSHWLSQQLSASGFKVVLRQSLPDKAEAITEGVATGLQKADIILITGGLGPTKDDITKKTLASFYHCELTERTEVVENIERLFKHRGRKLNELNRQQALVPQAAEVVLNAVGTAPGMWFAKDGRVVISMPGVPAEMRLMVEQQVLPRLKKEFAPPAMVHKMLRTVNVPESELAKIIEQWEDALPEGIGLAYLPNYGAVKLRLTATGDTEDALHEKINKEVQKLKPLISEFLFSEEDMEIEQMVGKLLQQNNWTLATAESCTGGRIADKITDHPGCSSHFQGGVVAYSNEVKINLLHIDKQLIEQHGAVSEEVACAMAKNVRKLCGTDFGISTTGIAGPGGGTPEKPVGTIWIGYADKDGARAKKLQLTDNRKMNINYTFTIIMGWLWKNLQRKLAKEAIA